MNDESRLRQEVIQEMKEVLRSRGVALKGPERKEEINEDAERARRALR